MFSPPIYADAGWVSVEDLNKPDHPQAALAVAVATELLVQLTAGMFPGVYQITEMYDTRTAMAVGIERYPALLHGVDYQTVNRGCDCDSCGVMHRIRLRGQRVRHILSVVVNGQPLRPTDYVLLDHSVLGFLTGVACCAACVTVRYEYGALPPASGHLAALKIANELIESLEPDGDCTLPQRVTSVSRQGVSWTLLDTQDFLEQGRTGIYEVDLFLKTYNPANALRPSRVYSVDRPRVTTTTMEYPPLASVLQPNDLVVIPGSASGWLISDPYAIDVLTATGPGGGFLTTPLLTLDGGSISVQPALYPLPDEQKIVTLMLASDVTQNMRYGMPWTLYAVHSDTSKELLLTGEVRTL